MGDPSSYKKPMDTLFYDIIDLQSFFRNSKNEKSF